jgi:two-component system response regulator PilR (NtrC family)
MTTASHFSLLGVDDEPDLRTLYELTLLREGYDLDTAGTVQEALLHLKDRTYSAVITDMRLPDGSGLDVLRWLEESNRREKAIVITAYGSSENAVEALKAGAYDYLTKPVDLKQFRGVVASALGRGGSGAPTVDPTTLPSEHRASVPPRPPRPAAAAPAPATPVSAALGRMAGQSVAMQQVRSLVEKVARSMAPVLVSGESGTGKELVARAIHEVSARGAMPFVPVNCSAIPEQLLEAEFFGYRKGAFTGANDDREGFFQAANGGTLFLDEVADLPLPMQVKLLRAIQEKKVRKVGSTQEEPVDVRLISATHKKLGTLVENGEFRQDLYYRLHVIELLMPPLREMGEDIPVIANTILNRLARGQPASLEPDAVAALNAYPFPGNVRELENILERGLSLAADPTHISAEDLHLTPPIEEQDVSVPPGEKWPLQDYLDRVERAAINEALEKTRFNRTAAAKLLGITFRAMRYRMERLGIK